MGLMFFFLVKAMIMFICSHSYPGAEDLGGLRREWLFTSNLHQASSGSPHCLLGSHSETQPPGEGATG